MDSSVTVVGHFLGMFQRPTRIRPPSGVPGICAHGCVTLIHRDSHLVVTNLSGESSVALALQFPVPHAAILIIDRHPHLDFNRGIGTRHSHRHEPAERPERLVEGSIHYRFMAVAMPSA